VLTFDKILWRFFPKCLITPYIKQTQQKGKDRPVSISYSKTGTIPLFHHPLVVHLGGLELGVPHTPLGVLNGTVILQGLGDESGPGRMNSPVFNRNFFGVFLTSLYVQLKFAKNPATIFFMQHYYIKTIFE
jgi:hypothetical protein